MKLLIRASLVMALMAATACTNPGRFSGDGAAAGASANAGIIPGSVDDPTSVAYFNQTVGDRVLFAVDQSSLGDEARATLAGQAQWLIDNRDYVAVIEGHADEQGTREYNLALGARRAAAVQEYLISQGISPTRLKTVTYGKERPLEICSAEECYAKNRRAVTVLAAGGIS